MVHSLLSGSELTSLADVRVPLIAAWRSSDGLQSAKAMTAVGLILSGKFYHCHCLFLSSSTQGVRGRAPNSPPTRHGERLLQPSVNLTSIVSKRKSGGEMVSLKI